MLAKHLKCTGIHVTHLAVCVAPGDAVDPLTLLATGLLNQEKRLQAVEQKLQHLSSGPTNDWGTAQMTDVGRPNWGKTQAVQNREDKDIPTRVKYLEEDMVDHRHSTDHKLQVVYDQARELQRRESKDIRELHDELVADVNILEKDINTTFQITESDIDTVDSRVDMVEKEVGFNTDEALYLRNLLFKTIEYINKLHYETLGFVYDLDIEVQDIKKQLSDLQQRKEGDEVSQKPIVGPVGHTGGIQSHHTTVSNAEKALREMMKQDPAALRHSFSTAREESAAPKPIQSSLEELMNELNKYNM